MRVTTSYVSHRAIARVLYHVISFVFITSRRSVFHDRAYGKYYAGSQKNRDGVSRADGGRSWPRRDFHEFLGTARVSRPARYDYASSGLNRRETADRPFALNFIIS